MAVPQIELVLRNRHYYHHMQINEVEMFGKPLGRASNEQVDLAHRITLQKFDRLKEDPDFYKNRLLSGPDYIEQELINSMRLNNYPQVACNPLDVDLFHEVRELAEGIIPGSESLSDEQFLEAWLHYLKRNLVTEENNEADVRNFLTECRTACGISAQFAGFLKCFGFPTARRIGWQGPVTLLGWKGFTEVRTTGGWRLVDFDRMEIHEESIVERQQRLDLTRTPLEFDALPPYAEYWLAFGVDIESLTEDQKLLLLEGGYRFVRTGAIPPEVRLPLRSLF